MKRAYFSLTVLVSAFLLLLVQPMLAKMLLPHVGGAPATWIASMLFFQLLLLLGYGYAAITTRYFSPQKQWLLHVLLFIGAISFSVPLSLRLSDASATQEPVGWILTSLLLTIGPLYFILSASSSLLQRWYHSISGQEPYFLFSASNLGSFLGLFAYPLIIEWSLGLAEQLIWFGYGFVALFLLFAGFVMWLRKNAAAPEIASIALERKSVLHAIILAFFPSALFLSVTLYITTDIGSFPLIWVIPLAIYLFSFVVAFSPRGERWIAYTQKLHVPAILVFFICLLSNHYWAMVGHFIVLFIICVSGHGQLARIRPEPEKLTAFFFWVSVGGALGGAFNLLMPFVLNSAIEYPVLVILSPLLLPATRSLKEALNLPEAERKRAIVFVAFVAVMSLLIWLVPSDEKKGSENILHQSRNFYGVSQVQRVMMEDEKALHRYLHGTTLHGIQSEDEAKRLSPVSYYAPINNLLSQLPDSYFEGPFAMLGMGVGTVACYGRQGQQVDFYEIDQTVIDIAQDAELFTYLSDCPPEIRILKGDGRVMLQAQPEDIDYHLLIVDVFTSDAIPLHIVTKEAIEMYVKRLDAEQGMIAVNISNRYYGLAPFLSRIGKELGWKTYYQRFEPEEEEKLSIPSEWVVMVPTGSPWEKQIGGQGFIHFPAKDSTPLWTDDYSNILPALK